jgi:hydroxymethylbilane synthase
MNKTIRIGTRDSQLAVWQATWVQQLLQDQGIASELVYIKSEGDIDLVTPLYEIGVQGIFTKTLDAALLSNKIDIAVHSMKDVPTQPAKGLGIAAILERASHKDILVFKDPAIPEQLGHTPEGWHATPDVLPLTIATSSVRRKAQWLHRYPHHQFDNLRGNVNTRLRKLAEQNWHGAIFAAAGLERINLRPALSIDLDWMLPAPAQGAVVIVNRTEDKDITNICAPLHHLPTAQCVTAERHFLRRLMGGCATPISALATVREQEQMYFQANVLSLDGSQCLEVTIQSPLSEASAIGEQAAQQLLDQGAASIIENIRHAGQ